MLTLFLWLLAATPTPPVCSPTVPCVVVYLGPQTAAVGVTVGPSLVSLSPITDTFQVSKLPAPATLPLTWTPFIPWPPHVYRNGARQFSPPDYSITGNVLTFTGPLQPADTITVDYWVRVQ